MAVFINHYTVLGFSSSQKRSTVSKEEIKKAYRLQALKLHPDKRLDDPNAASAFQQLQESYEILKDDNAKKAFDYSLIIREQQHHREMKRKKMSDLEEEAKRKHRKMMSDCRKLMTDLEEGERKHRKMMADLEEVERKHRKMTADLEEVARKHRKMTSDLYDEKERKRKKMTSDLEEVNRFHGRHANQKDYTFYDKEKTLKVYWETVDLDCNEKTLRKIFEAFGDVEYVVINKSLTNWGSANVVMATKQGADIAALKYKQDPTYLVIHS